jgi:hypothetical protein
MISTSTPSVEQLTKAKSYLAETRDALLKSADALTEEQWNFKPSPDQWSIGENFEHIVILESRVHHLVAQIGGAPPPPEDWDEGKTDELILIEVPNRATKFKSPEAAIPKEGWAKAEAVKNFAEARERTIQLLDEPDLRGHVIPHPVLGFWDGYQWIVAVGAHGLRHLNQIAEVKACANFPRARA